MCLVGRIEKLRNRKLFYFVENKNEMTKKKIVICINLLSYPYDIKKIKNKNKKINSSLKNLLFKKKKKKKKTQFLDMC